MRTNIITHFALSKSETKFTIKSASLEVAVVAGKKTTFWLYSALLVIAQAATLERFGDEVFLPIYLVLVSNTAWYGDSANLTQ